jgi:hypothetical protein
MHPFQTCPVPVVMVYFVETSAPICRPSADPYLRLKELVPNKVSAKPHYEAGQGRGQCQTALQSGAWSPMGSFPGLKGSTRHRRSSVQQWMSAWKVLHNIDKARCSTEAHLPASSGSLLSTCEQVEGDREERTVNALAYDAKRSKMKREV